MKTPHPNRRQAQLPHSGRGWCWCDRAMVEHRVKCPVCGNVNGRRTRLKKIPPLMSDWEDK